MRPTKRKILLIFSAFAAFALSCAAYGTWERETRITAEQCRHARALARELPDFSRELEKVFSDPIVYSVMEKRAVLPAFQTFGQTVQEMKLEPRRWAGHPELLALSPLADGPLLQNPKLFARKLHEISELAPSIFRVCSSEPPAQEDSALPIASVIARFRAEREKAEGEIAALGKSWERDQAVFCQNEQNLSYFRKIMDTYRNGCGRRPANNLNECENTSLQSIASQATQLDEIQAVNRRKLQQKWPAPLFQDLHCAAD